MDDECNQNPLEPLKIFRKIYENPYWNALEKTEIRNNTKWRIILFNKFHHFIRKISYLHMHEKLVFFFFTILRWMKVTVFWPLK